MFRSGLLLIIAISIMGVGYSYLTLQNRITALRISLPKLEQCLFNEQEKHETLRFQMAQISSPESLFRLMECPEHQNLVQAEFVMNWTIFLDKEDCDGG